MADAKALALPDDSSFLPKESIAAIIGRPRGILDNSG
jgi:hypothetical protein